MAIRRGAGPLHRQIHDLVRREIVAGRLVAGEQLPTEGELAECWDLSLAPVRQALLDLVAEGYLERNQGRGTFVRETKIEEKLSVLSSFSDSHKQQGEDTELARLYIGVVPAAPDVAEALGTGKRKLALIRRVAALDSNPVALLSAYLDPRRFRGIEKVELEGGSLYRTLAVRYGVELARASTAMEAVHVNEEDATPLGVRPGAVVFRVDSVTYDRENTPVEFSRVLYRIDRFKFVLESVSLEDQVLHFPASSGVTGA
jgi:GntR family transcriptional regulator, N-acetylglucosamine utilization regulator